MLLLSILFGVARIDQILSQERIFRGKNAPQYAYPFMVSLYSIRYNKHWCGGLILDELNILTAAHCIKKESFQLHEVKVLIGDYIKNYRDFTQVSLKDLFNKIS